MANSNGSADNPSAVGEAVNPPSRDSDCPEVPGSVRAGGPATVLSSTSGGIHEQCNNPTHAGVGVGGGSCTSTSAVEYPLRIETKTWQRDSHDLFDYEEDSVVLERFSVAGQARVFRRRTEIEVMVDGAPLPAEDADCLLNVKVKDGKYLIAPAERTLPQNIVTKKLWTVVKELPGETHMLQESDIIKLGRYKLKVKQLVRKFDTNPEIRLDDSEAEIPGISLEEAQNMQCRICLTEGGSASDPLICPCLCKGSIKFVHVECLRHWINGRLNLTDDSRFFFKQLPCELCKQHFPLNARLIPTGEKIQIAKIPQPTPPYLVLENMVGPTNHKGGFHVMSMSDERKVLKLGRGHESDLRIPDVSISRFHATIGYDDGKFSLGDHESKFGTLVSLRRPQALDAYGDPCMRKFSVQVGRTVLNFHVDVSLNQSESFIKDDVSVVAPDATPSSTPHGNGSGRETDRGKRFPHLPARGPFAGSHGNTRQTNAETAPADFGDPRTSNNAPSGDALSSSILEPGSFTSSCPISNLAGPTTNSRNFVLGPPLAVSKILSRPCFIPQLASPDRHHSSFPASSGSTFSRSSSSPEHSTSGASGGETPQQRYLPEKHIVPSTLPRATTLRPYLLTNDPTVLLKSHRPPLPCPADPRISVASSSRIRSFEREHPSPIHGQSSAQVLCPPPVSGTSAESSQTTMQSPSLLVNGYNGECPRGT